MQYPLQALFEIRGRAKQEAEDAYAREKQRLDQEQNQLKKMQEKLKCMQAYRHQKQAEYFEAMSTVSTRIETIQMAERHLQKLLEEEKIFQIKMTEQEQIVYESEQKRVQALKRMMKATEEYNVLEKHQEKWAAKQKKEAELREEAVADEMTEFRYAARVKESMI
ncbi:MAG: hypothetical protein I8H75_04145 [Myxococcaceae bacterium]|nr:hypothetical protein [Myxococcaceae bacterium]